MSNTRTMIGAGAMAVLGAWMLFFQASFSAARRRQHEARLADRLARGTDAYFEELRDIRAYAPGRFSPGLQRLGGALLILFGVSYLALNIAR